MAAVSVKRSIPRAYLSGGFRGGARGAWAPPYFRPKWSPKGRKKLFFNIGPRPPYLRVWMTFPAPTYLKVWIRHYIYHVKSVETQTIKPEKDHCVLPHYLRTNKSLSTKRFPMNHVTRNWQEQDLTTVTQNVPKCEQKILYSPGSTLRNMKHARNRESVRQTSEVEVLLLNGWEWLQHLEYPSLKQEGGRGVAGSTKNFTNTS